MQFSKPMLTAGRKAAPSGGVFPSQRMERSSSPDLPARLKNQNKSQLCKTRHTKTTRQEVFGFILMYGNGVFPS